MSIVRALDTDGDWTFGKGRNNYLSGIDAVSQNITTRLKSFLGDCFFDLSAGIDWFNLLGSKEQLKLNLAVTAVILNTPDVLSINQLSIDLSSNRKLTITYDAFTNVGGATASASGTFDLLLTETGNVLVSEGEDPLVI